MPPSSPTSPVNASAPPAARQSPDYGIDAPGVRRWMFTGGAIGATLVAAGVIVATRSS